MYHFEDYENHIVFVTYVIHPFPKDRGTGAFCRATV